jgi:hypothetical protein
MAGGPYFFWLGADAPKRWFFRQYGYEKFSIFDERGAEIGFVHRRRDAERIATEWTA